MFTLYRRSHTWKVGRNSHRSILNIYFPSRGFQFFPLLIHFCCGPNIWSNFTEVAQRTFPICDAPLAPKSTFLCVNTREWARSFSLGVNRHGWQKRHQMWPLTNYFCIVYPFELNVCRMVGLCIPNSRMFFCFSILKVLAGKWRHKIETNVK